MCKEKTINIFKFEDAETLHVLPSSQLLATRQIPVLYTLRINIVVKRV